MTRRGKSHKRSRKRAALAELANVVYVASPRNGGSDRNHGRYPWRPMESIRGAMAKLRDRTTAQALYVKCGSVFA
jgi:hypothetical protein